MAPKLFLDDSSISTSVVSDESLVSETSFDISFETSSDSSNSSEPPKFSSTSIEASFTNTLSSILISSAADAAPTKDIKQNNIKIIKIELIILVLIKCPPFFNNNILKPI